MLKRLVNWIHGFLHLAVGGLEKRRPEALLELEKENLRKQLIQYNQGLVSHSALCERLMGQIRKLEEEEQLWRARVSACLELGDEDAAAQSALRHEMFQRELAENRIQLQQAEQTYQELRKVRDLHFKSAQAKLEGLRFALDELKIRKATAELTEMASGLVTVGGGPADTLERLRTMVEEERARAAGRARVARDDFQGSRRDLWAAEQKAMEKRALERFLARQAAPLPDSPPAASLPPGESKPPDRAGNP